MSFARRLFSFLHISRIKSISYLNTDFKLEQEKKQIVSGIFLVWRGNDATGSKKEATKEKKKERKRKRKSK